MAHRLGHHGRKTWRRRKKSAFNHKCHDRNVLELRSYKPRQRAASDRESRILLQINAILGNGDSAMDAIREAAVDETQL